MVNDVDFYELVKVTAKEIRERCISGFDGIKFNGYGNCMVAKIDGIEEAEDFLERSAKMLGREDLKELSYRLGDLAGELKGYL